MTDMREIKRGTRLPEAVWAGGFAIHLISWFSPVHREVDTGWAAFATCWPGLWRLAAEHEAVSANTMLQALSPHTNYVVVWATVLMFRKDPAMTWLRWSGWLLAASLLCDASWLAEGDALRFGYYLWLVSFAVIAGAMWLKRRDVALDAGGV